jgi:hypothetical protein
MLPNPITGADTFDIQFDVKYNDYAKLSDSNKDACINNFKPIVISNIEFGNLSELQNLNIWLNLLEDIYENKTNVKTFINY